MKIGLLRHFKTAHRFIQRCDSEEYNHEYSRYENSHIIPVHSPDYTDEYTICFASPAPRAMETASAVYKKEIIPCPDLREVPLQAIFNTHRKLPIKFWHFLNRFGWAFNMKKMPETRAQTNQRALRFLLILSISLQKKQTFSSFPGFKPLPMQVLNGLGSPTPFGKGFGGHPGEKVLVVTHGFFMVTLLEELKRMGFKGKEFLRPEFGGLYEFSLKA